jgi:signal transduction histidine kinase
MDYTLIYAGIIIYITGGLTVFLVFHKQILNEFVRLNSPNRTIVGNDMEIVEVNALLNSTIDVSTFANVTDTLELERQRIGSDIHDDMAPHLSSLYIDLELVSKEGDALSHEAAKLLLDMRHKIKYTIESLRRIIYGMLPTILENQTFNDAIKELCHKHEGLKGTRILFRSSDQTFVLSDQQALYLYRIIQELINNCLKHSRAWNIYVTVEWTEQKFKLTVKHNGIELPKYISQAGKYGMTGIFIRARIIGATAKFNSPAAGMEFELILPIDKTLTPPKKK